MSEACLNITHTDASYVVRFRNATILDTLTVQRISRELYEVLECPGAQCVVIDFQDVRFLSSHALGVLLTLRRRAAKGGVKVALAGLRPELLRVFQATKLDQVFTLFESGEAALAHFGVQPGASP